MIEESHLIRLMSELESDLVERKASIANPDKIREAICAFANDLPEYNAPGVVFVGVHDDGSCANANVDDKFLLTLANMKSDGNIVPPPSMTVRRLTLSGCTVAVVEVQPSDATPVRYNGRIWVRVGPRRSTATEQEEMRLVEKRQARSLPADLRAVPLATMDDLDVKRFRDEYLPSAVAREVLAANNRTVEQQLASLRFVEARAPHRPTVVGVLMFGFSPTDFLPGAYVQFQRHDGVDYSDDVVNAKEVHGTIPDVLRRLDEIVDANVFARVDPKAGVRDTRNADYPKPALTQAIANAVMHRDYLGSHAPARIAWFDDRIEIVSPGGPYGAASGSAFGQPGVTDYRNPGLAAALKDMGYVQRFGFGIPTIRKDLERNGNPPPEFDVVDARVSVVLRRAAS